MAAPMASKRSHSRGRADGNLVTERRRKKPLNDVSRIAGAAERQMTGSMVVANAGRTGRTSNDLTQPLTVSCDGGSSPAPYLIIISSLIKRKYGVNERGLGVDLKVFCRSDLKHTTFTYQFRSPSSWYCKPPSLVHTSIFTYLTRTLSDSEATAYHSTKEGLRRATPDSD
jgi:hypothetical protein